ncbi:hypothetical protein PR048_007290 [Dryococelus australis]|uniref:Uncharacterized protein n=1 Tax=Dryococelus australis TaxID=614101 RepID=A0ABQ9ID80_9NEOP|nr:hypothetical protein PR048_007290 [Dryococelus australis]
MIGYVLSVFCEAEQWTTNVRRNASTFQKVHKKDKASETLANVNIPQGRQPILIIDVEILLVQYSIEMDVRYNSLRRVDIKRLAFLTCYYKLRTYFRHSNFPDVRTPEGTSVARNTGFNPERVSAFYNLYEVALQNGPQGPPTV